MAFSRRGRPLAEEEKSTDAAKARARAMELLAGQELSSGQLYERLGRRFTQPTAAAVVAEMVERQYVDDERYARTRAHGLLAARKAAYIQPEPNIKTGWLSRYARMVTSANLGAVLK